MVGFLYTGLVSEHRSSLHVLCERHNGCCSFSCRCPLMVAVTVTTSPISWMVSSVLPGIWCCWFCDLKGRSCFPPFFFFFFFLFLSIVLVQVFTSSSLLPLPGAAVEKLMLLEAALALSSLSAILLLLTVVDPKRRCC